MFRAKSVCGAALVVALGVGGLAASLGLLTACQAGEMQQQADLVAEGSATGSVAPPEGSPVGTGEVPSSLLARARASMRGGEISPAIGEEIMASGAPEHRYAQRVLASMGAESVGAARVPAAKSSSSAGTDSRGMGSPRAAAPRREATGEDPRPETNDDANSALAVLTRLALETRGQRVILSVRASAPIDVGIVRQPDARTVRLVVKSAGALPGVLQGRPSAGGVTVADVRRGERTVQIALTLDEGLRPEMPKLDGAGATLSFSRP